MSYEKLLFSAYLRPKESPLANTRLFFGVECEIRTEKSKSGYKLKVVYIILFQQKKTMFVSDRNRGFLSKPASVEFIQMLKIYRLVIFFIISFLFLCLVLFLI